MRSCRHQAMSAALPRGVSMSHIEVQGDVDTDSVSGSQIVMILMQAHPFADCDQHQTPRVGIALSSADAASIDQSRGKYKTRRRGTEQNRTNIFWEEGR